MLIKSRWLWLIGFLGIGIIIVVGLVGSMTAEQRAVSAMSSSEMIPLEAWTKVDGDTKIWAEFSTVKKRIGIYRPGIPLPFLVCYSFADRRGGWQGGSSWYLCFPGKIVTLNHSITWYE